MSPSLRGSLRGTSGCYARGLVSRLGSLPEEMGVEEGEGESEGDGEGEGVRALRGGGEKCGRGGKGGVGLRGSES